MVPHGATVVCPPGDMSLSLHAFQVLTACFEAGDCPRRPWPGRIGGTWYCPADATQMAERDGVIVCTQCGRALPIVQELIELHPHRGTEAEERRAQRRERRREQRRERLRRGEH